MKINTLFFLIIVNFAGVFKFFFCGGGGEWLLHTNKILVIACMVRRRQGYLSYDYFSVTPVFPTESMLLLKFTCIFLKAPSRKQSFFHFHMTRSR